MNVYPTGRMGRDRVFCGGADRVVGKLTLLFMVVGIPREMSGPSLAGLHIDFGAAAFFAVMGWFCFRMGFRTRLVARSDHFEVVNLLTVERLAYRDVVAIELDLLSIRLTLGSGKRIRVWGLSDSLLNTDGTQGKSLVDRLSEIVAERQTDDGPHHTRTRFPDRWVLLALFALFASAIAYRLLTL